MRHIGEILSAAIEEINDHLDPEFKDVYQGEIHQRMVDMVCQMEVLRREVHSLTAGEIAVWAGRLVRMTV
jgi:hypothetical protein